MPRSYSRCLFSCFLLLIFCLLICAFDPQKIFHREARVDFRTYHSGSANTGILELSGVPEFSLIT